MNIWRSLEEFPAGLPNPVFTIGNFDGLHLGHREIIETVHRYAREAAGTPLVMTFDPHPAVIVAPSRAPRLLTPLPMKLELFKKSGIAGMLALSFTEELSRLTPEQFAGRVLAGRLKAKHLVVGDNFHFGHKQAGDVRKLAELGRKLGFGVTTVAPVKVRGHLVSSSHVRQLLNEGRISLANRMLGRCFSVRGLIVPGKGIGRSQTVPTLNLEKYDEQLPARGVYVTETVCDGMRAVSATNVGYSPTFNVQELRVESFLLEGTPPPDAGSMEVIFWHRLRDERVFPSAAALKEQILRDVARTRAFFRRLRQTARAAD